MTSSAGSVEVKVGPERLALLASSRFSVRSLTVKDVAISLEQGTLVAEVDPTEKNKHFHVHTRDAEITVTGTIFEVEVTPNGSGVTVARGSVLVEPSGQPSIHVESGERVWLEAGHARRETLDAEARAKVIASLDVAATPVPGEATKVSLEETEALPLPSTTSKKPKRRAHPTRNVAGDALLDAGQCSEAQKAFAASGAKWAADVRAGSAVEVGDCFYAQGDRDAALRVYRETANRFPQTLAGANARYEVGRVASQLGQRADAIAAFTAYAAQYPNAPLAPEALFRACSFQYEEGQLEQSLTCLKQYQAKYAHGRRNAEAALLEATLLRTVGNDCAGAIVAYDAYLKTPGPQEKEARQWRDWCARQPGAPPTAR